MAWRSTTLLGWAACAPLTALAQGEPAPATEITQAPQADAARPAWRVIVSPYVWGASLGGDIGLAGLQTPVHLPFSDIFDHLRLAAMGNVEIVHGRLGGYVDGQYVRTHQDEQVGPVPVELGVRTTRLAAGIFYKAWVIPGTGETAFGVPRDVSVEPTAGIRWTDLRADVKAAPLAIDSSKSADWIEPFAGVRVNADLSRHWNLFTEADLGGFGIDGSADISVNAQAYLGYRARLFGRPTVLRLGYRLIYQKYEQPDFTGRGNFRWDVQQRGPVAGFSMIF